MPRNPKKTKADIVALVEAALTRDLPLQTGSTVSEPPPPAPEPAPRPVPPVADAPKSTAHPVTKPRLRSIETKVIGGAKVHLIDAGYPNRVVGVQFEMPDGERPTEAVKTHLREGDAPLSYWPEAKAWLKRTGQTPSDDRADVEMRFADAVATLRAEKEGPSR